MKLKILTEQARILDILDAEIEDVITFIKNHDNPHDFNIEKCGYCKNCHSCQIMKLEGRTINSDACPIFKYKHPY